MVGYHRGHLKGLVVDYGSKLRSFHFDSTLCESTRRLGRQLRATSGQLDESVFRPPRSHTRGYLMLSIPGSGARDCDGVTRRSFVQAGVLGLGGLAWPDLLRMRAVASAVGAAGQIRECAGKSVILFWLSGGPGTWRPGTPSRTLPVNFAARSAQSPPVSRGSSSASSCPKKRALMDKLAIVRTVNHGTGDHTKANHWMLTGFEGPAFNAPDNDVSAGRRWVRPLPG